MIPFVENSGITLLGCPLTIQGRPTVLGGTGQQRLTRHLPYLTAYDSSQMARYDIPSSGFVWMLAGLCTWNAPRSSARQVMPRNGCMTPCVLLQKTW